MLFRTGLTRKTFNLALFRFNSTIPNKVPIQTEFNQANFVKSLPKLKDNELVTILQSLRSSIAKPKDDDLVEEEIVSKTSLETDKKEVNALSPKTCNLLLTNSITRNNPSLLNMALEIVENQKINHNIYTYTTLITAYGKLQDISKVNRTLSEMSENGIKPNIILFSSLFNIYTQIGDTQAVLELFEKTKSICHLDLLTFNLILSYFVKIQDIENVKKFRQEMLSANVQPDIRTYGILLKLYGNIRDFDEIERLLQELADNDLLHNDVTYNNLITIYGKQKAYDLVLLIMKKMTESNIMPDIVTFTTLIQQLFHEKDFVSLKKYHDEMKSLGLTLDIKAYAIFYNAYAMAGDLDAVDQLTKQQHEQGLPHNAVTINTLLKTYSARKHIVPYSKSSPMVFNLMRLMSEQKIKPDRITFSLLFEYFGYFKVRPILRKCHDQMLRLGFQRDAHLFHSLMKGYGNIGNIEEVKKLKKQLVDEGFPCDISTYNILLDIYMKNKDPNSTLELLAEMEELKIQPDITTFTTLIVFFGQTNDMVAVKRCQKQLELSGIRPNHQWFSALSKIYRDQNNEFEYRHTQLEMAATLKNSEDFNE